jgi:hypothetical protein
MGNIIRIGGILLALLIWGQVWVMAMSFQNIGIIPSGGIFMGIYGGVVFYGGWKSSTWIWRYKRAKGELHQKPNKKPDQKCPECGLVNGPGAKACSNCGPAF